VFRGGDDSEPIARAQTDPRLDSLVDTSPALAPTATPPGGPVIRISPDVSLEIRDLAELAPAAVDYLATRHPQWGAAMLIAGDRTAFEENGRQQFPLASLTKVLLLAAFLDTVAAEERDLTFFEDVTLRDMITVSDNFAADEVWGWIGRSTGLTTFLREQQVVGVTPGTDGLSWGDTTASALGLGQFLARLAWGDILSDGHRAYALELLTSVDESQRWGAPLAFPADAPVAVKDGWYPALTGWRVGSGAIDLAGEAVLVVLTRNQPDMESAIETIEGVAEAIAASRADGASAAGPRVNVHLPETLQALFQPSAEGLPALPGDCVPSASVRRAGSWSCVVEGNLFERCFTSIEAPQLAICDATPSSAGTFAVELEAGLVEAVSRPPQVSPWLLLLEDGTQCTFVLTPALNEDGDRVTYQCEDGTVLVGPLQRSLAFFALRGDAELTWLQTVRVAAAWF
jgi:hypothetical protein